jgi:hypothetical protein
MWLFTRYGFYSVVCAVGPDGGIDHDTMAVRARCVDHLVRLQQRFPALAGTDIIESPHGDYHWRLMISRRRWTEIAEELAAEIDWTNFRNEVTACQALNGRHYLDAIQDVWDRMAHF